METTQSIPTEDLPLWMRRARQSIDWGILLTMLLSALAVWPFLLQDGLPPTNAAQNHAFRALDYRASITEGRLYPRWAAGAALGYGAPIYNYTEPAYPYMTAAVSLLLIDDDITQAVRITAAGSLFMAGVMTYVFVMRVSGAAAGIIAAMLTVYSPHIGLNTPYLTGDYPQLMTYALYPALLWSIMRVTERRHPLDFVTLTGLGVLLVLTDVHAIPWALLISMILVGVQMMRGVTLRRVGLVALAGVSAAAISAFYWWPAWMEQGAITWVDAPFALASSPLTFGALIQPLPATDLNALAPQPIHTLGAGLVFMVVVAVMVIAVVRRQAMLLHGVFLLLGGGILLYGITQAPQQTHILGVGTFVLAIGCSGIVYLRGLLPDEFKRLVLPTVVIMILGSASSIWLAPQNTTTRTYSLYDQIVYELLGYGVAVLPPGAASPQTIEQPIANNALIVGYREGDPIRIPNLRLTGEKRASYLSGNRHNDRYVIDARETAVFDVLRAYAPGWRATLNGNPLNVSPNPANQLMQIQAPATNGQELLLHYGSTPERQLGWGVSAFVLFSLTLTWGYRLLRFSESDQTDDLIYLTVPEARLLTIVGVSFFLVILMFAAPNAPLSLYARPGHALDNFVSLRTTSPDNLEAIGYQRRINDEQLTVTLAWRGLDQLNDDYYVQAFVEDQRQGLRWLTTSPRFIGHIPSRWWTPFQYVMDTYRFDLDTLIPGEYRVGLAVFACQFECNTRLPQIFDSQEILYLPFEVTIANPPLVR